jgi:hypothetical protein
MSAQLATGCADLLPQDHKPTVPVQSSAQKCLFCGEKRLVPSPNRFKSITCTEHEASRGQA